MPKRNEWIRGAVDDWDIQTGWHGYGRVHLKCYNKKKTDEDVRRYYVVKLCVLGKQYEISRHKDQREAAQAYDAALSCLRPFAPKCSKPNFPDTFEALGSSDVQRLCPYAHILYDEARAQLKARGVNPDELEAQFKSGLTTPTMQVALKVQKRDPYSNLASQASRLSIDTHAGYVKFSENLAKVKLNKFPQLARTLVAAQLALSEATKALETARVELAENADFYESQQAAGMF
jgi:hypothetical protein